MQAACDLATLGTVCLGFTPGAGSAGLRLDRPEVSPAPERVLRDDVLRGRETTRGRPIVPRAMWAQFRGRIASTNGKAPIR
jgi:hypothetical protein